MEGTMGSVHFDIKLSISLGRCRPSADGIKSKGCGVFFSSAVCERARARGRGSREIDLIKFEFFL